MFHLLGGGLADLIENKVKLWFLVLVVWLLVLVVALKKRAQARARREAELDELAFKRRVEVHGDDGLATLSCSGFLIDFTNE